MSRKNPKRKSKPLVGSDIQAIVTSLRESLRGVVAFRSKLDRAASEDELRLLILNDQFPDHCLKALNAHRDLLYSLALSAKANESEFEKKVGEQIVAEKAAEDRVTTAPKVDRGLSRLAKLGRR